MAQLPEDIIDRITAMERRIRQLSTAVGTRPATTGVGGSAIRTGDVGDSAAAGPPSGDGGTGTDPDPASDAGADVHAAAAADNEPPA